MSKEASPSFQFFPKDFLADENVALMTVAERGVYITLLCFCWTEGSVPASAQAIGRLCSMSASAVQKIWPTIQRCFVENEGRLRHKRLDAEREKQAAWRNRLAESGRKGGLSRDQASLKHAQIRAPLESEGGKEQTGDEDGKEKEMRPEFDDQWQNFRRLYSQIGKPLIEDDFTVAHIRWRVLDFEQRTHALVNLAARKLHNEPQFIPSPVNYLKGTEYTREVVPRSSGKALPIGVNPTERAADNAKELAKLESEAAPWLEENPGKSLTDFVDWKLSQKVSV